MDAIDESLIRGRLTAHGGRELRELEGRAVIEFPDAERALGFAIDLQLALKTRNRNLREDQRILFRIGMENASQTADGEDAEAIAYGLMEMAEPGGICISGSLQTRVSSEINLTTERVDTSVFNIVPEAVGAYEIVLNEKARAFAAPNSGQSDNSRPLARFGPILVMATVLILGAAGYFYFEDRRQQAIETADQITFDRPSIVVLPFENLTQNNEGAMIAHGLTVSITSALSEVPQLAVISANAAFAFAQQLEAPADARSQFGVEYALNGSVQVQDNRVRVIVGLSDTETGQSVWSQRFDEDQADVFAVEDQITLQVLVALQVALGEGTRAVDRSKGTSNVDAYLGLMRAERVYQQFTKDSMIEARRLLKQVRELDPNYYQALVLEAKTYTYDAQLGYSDDPIASLQAAHDLLEQAAAIDGSELASEDAEVLIAKAYRDQIAEQYDIAVSQALAAAEASPNNSDVQALAGWVLSFNRDYERATDLLYNAVALDPAYPGWYANYISRNAAFLGQFDEAFEWADRGVSRAQNDRQRAWALFSLVFARVEAGDLEAAEQAGAEARRAWPGLTLDTLKRAQPYRYDADWQRFVAAMNTAGVLRDH